MCYTFPSLHFIFCRKEVISWPEVPDLRAVFKMDQIQGLPDLLILYGEKWASLECKRSATAKKRPNQDYYVEKMNDMSFSRFVCPENKEEVLNELQQAFQP